MLISIVTVLIYILPRVYEGSFPIPSSPAFVCFLDESLVQRESQCSFNLYFPDS
jgi:hypothetical protein